MVNSLFSSVLQSGPFAVLVLLVLLGCSLAVWAILLRQWVRFRNFRSANATLREFFHNEPTLGRFRSKLEELPEGPLQRLMVIGDQEIEQYLKLYRDNPSEHRQELLELLERAFEAGILQEERKLQAGQTTLATISVTAPFIGLFGTVIGIINTFQSIANLQSVELTVVGPGISEALVATGAGLFAAIPAALGYNVFRALSRANSEEMEGLALQFLKRLQFQLLASHEKNA
jgi:biopolymer transport protein TolQ